MTAANDKSDASFVGEPISPRSGAFDTSSMATGAPGLPAQFTWRKQEHSIAEVLETWKSTGACRSGSQDRYVRKHWYKIRTTTGEVMVVHCDRQPPRSGSKTKNRWTLYTIEK